MINSIEISNFKNIRHQKIDLERLTVFVGPNGSGKTSVLEAFDLLRQAINVSDNIENDPAASQSSQQLQSQLARSIRLTYDKSTEVKASVFGQDISMVAIRRFFGMPHANRSDHGNWDIQIEPDRKRRSAIGSNLLTQSTNLIKFDASKLAETSYSDTIPTMVQADGSQLSSTLAYMALNDPDEFTNIVAIMKSLIPQLVRVRFTKRKIQRSITEKITIGDQQYPRAAILEYQGDALLFDFLNGVDVPAESVSEGTLVMLGLLTVLFGPKKPQVLLLDDIDRGLHPLAQASLIVVLNQLMDRFPKLQILATSHSPYLLDSLEAKQVRLMTIDNQGNSVCGKLTDHPQFDRWKDEMAPGELWSLFGEKWVAEGSLSK